MYIFGFPIPDDNSWGEDPFEQGHIPEDYICEVCHIYKDSEGRKYIGIEVALGMKIEEMVEIMSPFSTDLGVRKVIV
jgi:hypothetical protein